MRPIGKRFHLAGQPRRASRSRASRATTDVYEAAARLAVIEQPPEGTPDGIREGLEGRQGLRMESPGNGRPLIHSTVRGHDHSHSHTVEMR
jgi:hypothetical protein